MAPRKPKPPEPLELGEETWGERLRRAYYRSKQAYGHNWENLAQRVSQVHAITDTSLMRLMDYEDKPARTKQLQMAWLLAIALGIEPEELDLYEEDINAPLLASQEVFDLLVPGSPCFSISAA